VISDISFVITVVIVHLVPFYLGYRIATRRGFKGAARAFPRDCASSLLNE